MWRNQVRIWSALAVLAASLVVVAGVASPAGAAPGDPFDPADSTVFVAQDNPTQLFRALPDGAGTVTFEPEGPPSSIAYNAIAYNPADDYVWAVKNSNPTGASGPSSWPTGSVLRVGENGVITRVGTSSVGTGANAGAFGGDGYYYVGSSGSATMRRIHPVTGSVTDTYTLPVTTGAADLAYANGYFWGANANGQVVRVLLGATPQVDVFASPVPANGGYGAAWTYGNGNLGFSNNATGQIVQVSVTNPGGTPSFTLVSTQPGPASSTNDGAASLGMPTDLAITKVGPVPLVAGSQATYTLTVTNNGPGNASGYVVTDTVPAPLTNVGSPTSGCTVAASTVTCTGGRLEAGQTVEITITADVPAGQYQCVTNAASVLANEEDTNAANDTATVQSCPDAALTLEKSTEATAIDTPGQIVTYDLTVTNTGPVTITDIAVTDPMADAVACPLTALGPGQSMSCDAEHVVTQAELDAGGLLVNTATVDGNGPGGPVPPADSPPVEVPIVQTPGLDLVKSANPVDSLPDAGEQVVFGFVATNTGNVTLTGVEVTDPLDGLSALDCDRTVPATLMPGEQLICSASYVVDQDDVDNGSLTNEATATGASPLGPIAADDDTSIPAEQAPGIALVKSADRVHVDAAGEVITYSLVATNAGNVTLTGVTITDPLDGLSALDCDQALPSDLAPGERLTCTATYEVSQGELDGGGTIGNDASATGTPPAGEDVNDGSSLDVPIIQEPDLNLQKSADPGEVDTVGEVITYSMVATNTGNVTLADVAIDDPLPNLSALDCDQAVPATLVPGAALYCTATYEVAQADLDTGGVTNVATTTGTPPTGPPVETPSPPVSVVAVTEPSLTITKTSDAEPYGVGDVVTYDFLVANDGNTTIVGVVVVDPLLDAPAVCPATELAPDDSMTCTGERTTTQDDVDAGELVNTATAQGVPPNGQRITTPPSTFTVPSEPHVPGLEVDKAADRTAFTDVGEVIGFSFVVTNTGNVTTTDIVVVDDLLDAPADCPSTVLAPGETVTCTGSRAITEADVAAGEFVNTAAASGTTPSGETVLSAVDTVRIAYEAPPGSAADPEATDRPRTGRSLAQTGAGVGALAQLGFILVAAGLILGRNRRRTAS